MPGPRLPALYSPRGGWLFAFSFSASAPPPSSRSLSIRARASAESSRGLLTSIRLRMPGPWLALLSPWNDCDLRRRPAGRLGFKRLGLPSSINDLRAMRLVNPTLGAGLRLRTLPGRVELSRGPTRPRSQERRDCIMHHVSRTMHDGSGGEGRTGRGSGCRGR
jgi:hypothetical protein